MSRTKIESWVRSSKLDLSSTSIRSLLRVLRRSSSTRRRTVLNHQTSKDNDDKAHEICHFGACNAKGKARLQQKVDHAQGTENERQQRWAALSIPGIQGYYSQQQHAAGGSEIETLQEQQRPHRNTDGERRNSIALQLRQAHRHPRWTDYRRIRLDSRRVHVPPRPIPSSLLANHPRRTGFEIVARFLARRSR